MPAAIEEAKQGLAEGGIPIGAVIVHNGRIHLLQEGGYSDYKHIPQKGVRP